MDYIKRNLPRNGSNGQISKLFQSLAKAIFIVVLLAIFFYYVYYTHLYFSIPCENKISYIGYLTNFGTPGICLGEEIDMDLEGDVEGEDQDQDQRSTSHGDEVFQISNQAFSYDDAKCKCGAYGARLATKAELTEAYNRGAHWCNYGWVEGGEAYYPVQQCELDRKAQNIREYNDLLTKHYEDPAKYTLDMLNEARNKMERENSRDYCGAHAGLNGGKFAGLNTRFGATCFGKKPVGKAVREKVAECQMSASEKARLERAKKEEAEKRTCGGKSNMDQIAAFNLDRW